MSSARAPAANRRVIGVALLASAAVMVLLAVLAGTGVIPLADESRTLVAVAIAAAAVIDGLIGLRFLLSSNA